MPKSAVASAEREDILGSHPEVNDCAVIGVYPKAQATELLKHARFPFHNFI